MQGWAIFLIIALILFLVSGASFFLYVRQRNRTLSSNYPAPAPGGIVGWVNDKLANLKRGRFTSGTGYETARGGDAAQRARALDPDEAWDANVGSEAYYEEQELGLHAQPTAYSGAGYGARSPGLGAQGGEGERELERTYEEESGGGAPAGRNPFGDDNATSLRSVGPRPLDLGAAQRAKSGSGSPESSPTAERRSVFREDV